MSIVIPAWNEAAYLPRTLESLRSALPGLGLEVEVLVVDNASTDGTMEVACAWGARVVCEPERRIARARNTGAREASAPWLLFLDADTLVTAEHLAAVRDALHDGFVGGGAPVALDASVSRLYTLGLGAWNGLSHRLGLAAGCFLFARAEFHDAVGGFDERVYAGDELGYSRALRREGSRHGLALRILAIRPVVSSARKVHWYAPWQHALVLLTFLLFPWAGRFRRLSWFWYRRPAEHSNASVKRRDDGQ
ncbi:glycosyltransferase [Aquisalimonas lutea]|uniref:glycosyltransferase n=1 Tax=Aquisalimonas lutea TaxID=1327750 RepID=UPI0025B3E7EF|nr:glycosyltransferase [Aquisalimonas lutea]MDN3517279.1 glycosyltransferase [Aquisalimonas lutea]